MLVPILNIIIIDTYLLQVGIKTERRRLNRPRATLKLYKTTLKPNTAENAGTVCSVVAWHSSKLYSKNIPKNVCLMLRITIIENMLTENGRERDGRLRTTATRRSTP